MADSLLHDYEKTNVYYEDLVLYINQDCWLDDSSEDEGAESIMSKVEVLSTEKAAISTASDMDKIMEEITYNLTKTNIIYEENLNGSLFKSSAEPSKFISCARKDSKPKTSKTPKPRKEKIWNENDWTPVLPDKPFLVKTEDFPALGK